MAQQFTPGQSEGADSPPSQPDILTQMLRAVRQAGANTSGELTGDAASTLSALGSMRRSPLGSEMAITSPLVRRAAQMAQSAQSLGRALDQAAGAVKRSQYLPAGVRKRAQQIADSMGAEW